MARKDSPFEEVVEPTVQVMSGRRLLLVRLFVLALLAALVAQLYNLQIVEGTRYAGQADQNRIRRIFTPSLRGVIYDRYSRLLVRNLPSFTISVLPADLPPEDEPLPAPAPSNGQAPGSDEAPLLDSAHSQQALYSRLAVLLQMDAQDIARKINAGKGNPFTPIVLKTNVDREVALIIEENRREMPGVQVEIQPIREYLERALMSHILGYVGRISQEEYDKQRTIDRTVSMNDMVGRMGIEVSFDEELRGQKGEKLVEVDALGREVSTLLYSTKERPGNSLVLTIDVELQRKMTQILQAGMLKSKSSSGAIVVLNPQTGEVLSLVSLPAYDDNLFASGISDEDWRRLINDPDRPLFNRAIGGAYPPGSIFKIVTASAGLQEGVIDRETVINCPGQLTVDHEYDPFTKFIFPCYIRSGHGDQRIVDALANSCDVYFYEVGGGYKTFSGLGVDRIGQYARNYGLGRDTGIDLPGESAGLVPDNLWKIKQSWNTRGEPWLTGDTYNLSIGQGFLLATPLQMANVVAAVANGGTLYRPQLIYQVIDPDGKPVKGYTKEAIGRIPVTPKNLDLVREGMRNAVTRGTAIAVNFPGLTVAGKTGTAEFGQPDAKGEHASHAWFLSFAPFDNPQVAVAVFVEGGGNGAAVAVPIAAEIYQYIFNLPPLAQAMAAP